MRFFTLLVLYLGVLALGLGLASPVPYLLNTIKGWMSDKTENGIDIVKRNVTELLTGLAPDSQEADDSADWNRCRSHGEACRSVKQSEEADLSSDGNEDINDVDSYVSSRYLPRRQTIDPISPEMNTPCVKALVAKYGQTDLNTLSFEDKQTLLKGIIDCVYGPVDNTYRNRVGARDSTDGSVPRVEVGKRCIKAQWQNAYLATHWDYLNAPTKLMYWVILVHCLKAEPGSPIKQLQERRSPIPEPAQLHCQVKAVEKWEAGQATSEDEDTFVLAFSELVDSSASEETNLVTREADGYHHVQDEDCMKKATGSWTGDLSTKEDTEAYIITVTGCIIPQPETLPTISNTTLALAKRKDCALTRQIYSTWADSVAASWVRHKHLDRSRYRTNSIIHELHDCYQVGVEWFYFTCSMQDRQPVLLN
jgi:hypothetical protein